MVLEKQQRSLSADLWTLLDQMGFQNPGHQVYENRPSLSRIAIVVARVGYCSRGAFCSGNDPRPVDLRGHVAQKHHLCCSEAAPRSITCAVLGAASAATRWCA